MITPRFKLSQDESSVSFFIRAPYCNLRDLEVSVEDNVFIFLASPYYLRLHLPGNIVENDCSKSSFDADTGEFTLVFEKANPGEAFPDLDLITKLLCPKIQVESADDDRKIVVLTADEKNLEKADNQLNEEFGFALAGKQNFHHVSSEFHDVFEIDPREVNLKERRKLRIQHEQGNFNADHYLSDYIENEEILEIMGFKSPWLNIKVEEVQFTDDELDYLKDLPNLEYNLSETQTDYVFCSLLDMLYAYCYDRRTTFFEGSSESGWTIIKLCASFSWLDAFKEPRETIISGFRRSLIYPLYRNFDLSQIILQDLKQVLKLGEKYIIKCLVEMYHIFLKGDCCRYIINNLFIRDYIIYIMKWDKSKWTKIVDIVENFVVEKSELGLNLIELEDDVSSTLDNLSTLNITEDDSDDTDSDSECTSSTDDDTSSDSNT